jgi:hypothetical protein
MSLEEDIAKKITVSTGVEFIAEPRLSGGRYGKICSTNGTLTDLT